MERHPTEPSTLTATLRANGRSPSRQRPGKAFSAFAVVASASSSIGSSRTFASSASVSSTFCGALSDPRSRCGARNGLSVSTRMRSERHHRGRLAHVTVLRIRHVAGEGQPVAAPRTLASDVGVAGEAMDHDVLRGTLIQHSKGVVPRVAHVHDHRLARPRWRARRGSEASRSARRARCASGTSPDRTPPHRSREAPAARSRPSTRPTSSNPSASWGCTPAEANTPSSSVAICERSLAGFHIDADAEEPVDAGGPRSLDRDCRFLVHQEQVAVGIHHPGLHHHFRVRAAHRGPTLPGLKFG